MSAPARVIVLATLATKAEETAFLVDRLQAHGVAATVQDISLTANGAVLDGPAKLTAMDLAVDGAIATLSSAVDAGIHAVIGLGGGTGGEIGLRVMRALPITFPKVLVTTLPFDPRIAVADSSIILVPTLADLAGLNATLREILENAAALTAGLCTTRRAARSCEANPSVGITALGATEGAVGPLVDALRQHGAESTVFHANGYGGAAFQRFAQRGAFHSIIDLTPHELTRLHIAGAHVAMPDRFAAAGHVPRIVLPGGLNFLGLGETALLPDIYRARAHYAHSGYFTHVKLTEPEMAQVADRLVDSLNALDGPVRLIVPMGGFSHQDRAGGAIEDPALRGVFLDQARAGLRADIPVTVVDAHISDPAVTAAIMAAWTASSDPNRMTEDVR